MSVPGRIALGLQGLQSLEHGSRGIGRYIREHAEALCRQAGPSVLHLDLDPELPRPSLPAGMEGLASSRSPSGLDAPVDLYHVMSPFERRPLERVYPLWARRASTRLAVTVFDLIPLVMPEHYLKDPGWARQYRTRLNLLRQADAVVAISEGTAEDVVRLLDIPRKRVFAVLAGCSPAFAPGDPGEARALVRSAVPGLGTDFILCTGGDDQRKNLPRLIEAYSELEPELRARHQLVIACHLSDWSRGALEGFARQRGVDGRVVLTGFVDDAVLQALYRTCRLFVFPSLYEGFGLPVLEAMRCGAVALASDNSSLRELVADRDARFDPTSTGSMTRAMGRALTDSVLRQRLAASGAAAGDKYTWDAVATRTLQAYEAVARPPRRVRSADAPRIAVFTPMPPLRTGIADYSYRLLDEMRRFGPIDVYVDGSPAQYLRPPGKELELIDAKSFPLVRSLRRYARVLYVMGNSSFHFFVRRALRECPGDVHAHDVRLVNLYQELAPFETVDASLFQGPDDPYQFGELARYAHRVFVHSEHARRIARAQGVADVELLPFGYPNVRPASAARAAPVIATFGMVTLWKQTQFLLGAFGALRARVPEARLVFAGSIGGNDESVLRAEAERLGLGKSVTFTGHLTEEGYQRCLDEALVAVQLRQFSNGEMSAALADCMAAGLPTIVTAVGGFTELPPDAAVMLRPAATERELSELLYSLIDGPERRASLSEHARQHATSNSFAVVAARLWSLLLGRRSEKEPVGQAAARPEQVA